MPLRHCRWRWLMAGRAAAPVSAEVETKVDVLIDGIPYSSRIQDSEFCKRSSREVESRSPRQARLQGVHEALEGSKKAIK